MCGEEQGHEVKSKAFKCEVRMLEAGVRMTSVREIKVRREGEEAAGKER